MVEHTQAPTRRLCLAALAAAVATPAAAQQNSRSLTFMPDLDGIFFAGALNGHPVTIMLDSGSGNLAVDRKFADQIGLESTGNVHAATGLVGSFSVEQSKPLRLSFTGIDLNAGGAALADLSSLGQAIGFVPVILGRQIFDGFVVEIDFNARRLTFHRPGTFDAAGWTRVALSPGAGGGRVVQLSIEGKAPISAGFDLGSNGALSLDGAYVRDAGLQDNRKASTWIRGGVDGISVFETTTVRSVRIADHDIANVPMDSSSNWAKAVGAPANIGFPLISRLGRVAIDYRSDSLYVFPGAAPARPFVKQRLGLALSPQAPQGWRVMHVAPGSPAARDGWKVGDEVIAINGQASMSAIELRTLTRGASGTVVRLTRPGGDARSLILADYD